METSQLSHPRIVCAAVQRGDGLVVACARHYDPGAAKVIGAMRAPLQWRVWRWLRFKRADAHSYFRSFGRIEQGFIDQHNRFYSRNEAWRIAQKNGQLLTKCTAPDAPLFSEDLY